MFIGRIASVLKDEGFSKPGQDSLNQARQYVYDVAAQPGLSESYHSALIADPPIEAPGASGAVITDAALLSAVTTVYNAVRDAL